MLGLLGPTQTPPFQLPLSLLLLELLLEELELLLPLPLVLLGLAGQEAGQKQDGVQVELDEPLPWQDLPASDGTDGQWSTPSRMARAMPPEK